ncbi:MAG: UpxY family transcription antiterminator [Bacteroidales bacterium]
MILTEKKNVTNQCSWFVLYTAPRSEKKVADRLSSMGLDFFLPMLQVQRKWSDRVKVVEVPLFNSYIFVKVPGHILFDLLKIYGVVKVVYYNGAPAVVRESEIDIIRKYIAQAGECEIMTGDTVEIVCGSLAGENKYVKGTIIKAKKNYLYLYVEQLGAYVCVKKQEVKKVKKNCA